ncbi:F-box protein At5g49610-like [Mercurialis annua]|uniref:F-box protein At5g49610-like n=1 Tax=Mercurialis annua TaxID=3986 RepID=UPI00215E3E81|nr:F-box protein At5g49610-like [Mercurialis annua]
MAGERKKTDACINRILSDDLLVEILHRIPCESAFRCKSVCKKWQNLISSPNFIKCFTRRRRSDHRKKIREGGAVVKCIFNHMFVIPSDYKQQFSFDFLPFFSSIQENPTRFIAGSCKGVFLCTADLKIQDQTVYYVCSPITKRWIALPPPPPLFESDESVHIYLGLAVTGFSSSKAKFKVVRVLPPVTGEKELSSFTVDVFSSKTGKWARLTTGTSPKSFTWYHTRTPAIYYRGLLHWHGTLDNQIVVYDLSKNSFVFIIDPPGDFEKYSQFLPVLSGGYFYVCQLEDLTLKMWQLNYLNNKQQPEWRLKCEFLLHQYICHGRRWIDDVFIDDVLTIHPYDHNILYLRAGPIRCFTANKYEKQYVVTCNLRTKTLNLEYESENDLIHCATATYTMGLRMWPPPISPAARP